jgi:beta-galactosidase
MRRSPSILASALAFLMLAATLPAPDAPVPAEIENEQMLGINKLPYHATLMPYANRAEALAADRHASSWSRSLDGPWKFNWVPRPEQRHVAFYKPDFDVSSWKEIPVPSNWQVLGYGTPYYKNNGYVIKKDWPRVMSEPPKNWTAYEVAVGTVVTHRPPHRPVLAALPHTVPTLDSWRQESP